MAGFILFLLLIGLIAGFVARALVPGRDRMGILGTMLLGLIGSFIGGFLGHVLFHHKPHASSFQSSGILGSIIGAVIALLVYRSANHRHRRRWHR